MALVPAGGFDLDAGADDLCIGSPAHVHVESFCIDVTEVSRKQFESCTSPGCGGKIPERTEGKSKCYTGHADDPPALCVGWSQAGTYCRARGARLPTAAEWEYAARGSKALSFPWGNESVRVDPDRQFNASPYICTNREPDVASPDGLGPCNVGSPGDRSPFGVLDMYGNVSEWTSLRCKDENGYPRFLTLGANYNTADDTVITMHRIPTGPEPDSLTGFRCASP